MYLDILRQWSPFKIDALGLVTILGADAVDGAIGSLKQSKITDWLPFLGGHVIASNQYIRPIPGFVLYNISDGILATDLAGWFARWLLSQDLTFNSTSVYITSSKRSQSCARDMCALVIGICALSPIIMMPAFMGDWWGFANSISMLVMTIIRELSLRLNRSALNLAAVETGDGLSQPVKVFLTAPNGKAVSVFASRGIVIHCLLTTPRTPYPRFYRGILMIGWLAFGCHIISLGKTTLFCQLPTVALLIGATILKVCQIGDDEHRIGSRLNLDLKVAERQDFRAAAYAHLQLSQKEEDSMVQWSMFPHRSNEFWWAKYRHCIANKSLKSFENWDQVLAKIQQVHEATATESKFLMEAKPRN